MWLVLFFVGVPLLFLLMIGYLRGWQVQTDHRQLLFINGTVPKDLPDGFYKGLVGGRAVSWKGKKFDAARKTGINILGDDNHEAFPFVMYVGKGITDTHLDVIKIDYSSRANTWWLRFVLDEIVEVTPGEYLGKVHLRIIPGFPFTLGYFTLETTAQ